jgi:hypothetical protein
MDVTILTYIGISVGTLLITIFILDRLNLVPQKLKPYVPYILFGIPLLFSAVALLITHRRHTINKDKDNTEVILIKDKSEKFEEDIKEVDDEIDAIKKEKEVSVDNSVPNDELSKFISDSTRD